MCDYKKQHFLQGRHMRLGAMQIEIKRAGRFRQKLAEKRSLTRVTNVTMHMLVDDMQCGRRAKKQTSHATGRRHNVTLGSDLFLHQIPYFQQHTLSLTIASGERVKPSLNKTGLAENTSTCHPRCNAMNDGFERGRSQRARWEALRFSGILNFITSCKGEHYKT